MAPGDFIVVLRRGMPTSRCGVVISMLDDGSVVVEMSGEFADIRSGLGRREVFARRRLRVIA